MPKPFETQIIFLARVSREVWAGEISVWDGLSSDRKADIFSYFVNVILSLVPESVKLILKSNAFVRGNPGTYFAARSGHSGDWE